MASGPQGHLHLHLQGKGGHRGQCAAGEDEAADALVGQLTHAEAGTEAPVTQHLPWGRQLWAWATEAP